MSSLIFQTNHEVALVATDSLVVTADTQEPFLFTSKSHYIPHLNVIIAGTGLANFLDDWFLRIISHIAANNVIELNDVTPEILQYIWQGYKEDFSVFLDEPTSTVYHFGFSHKDNCIKSFAYRSTNNFQSELLPYGLGYKPELNLWDDLKVPRDIKKMMESQRAIQSLKPKEKRLYIGGEIHLSMLTNEGCSTQTIDRFDDYDSDKIKINNLNNLRTLRANQLLKLTWQPPTL